MKRAALFGLVVSGCVMSAAFDREHTGTHASALSAPVSIATFESQSPTFGGARGFTVVGTKVVFGAQTGLEGSEPWVTDGTSAGTFMIRDMNGGPETGFQASAALGSFAVLALNDGAHGIELWKSDGTTAGTTLIEDLSPGRSGDVAALSVSGGFVYASVDGDAKGLWKTDGTAAGTTKLADVSAPIMVDANGTLFFRAGTGGLWKSDGTTGGTTMVSATTPRFVTAEGSMVAIGSTVFFVNDLNDRELWKSDGTTTTLVSTFPAAIDRIAGTGTKVFVRSMTAGGRLELTATDGTTTTSVAVPSPAAGAQSLDALVAANGALYFIANDGAAGDEVWKSDGTPGGTAMIADQYSGAGNGALIGVRPVAWNDGIAFTGTTSSGNYEPYFTNGSTPQKIFEVAPGGTTSFSPGDYFVNGTTLYFFVTATGAVKQLWKSTGVGNATIVKDGLSAAQVGAAPVPVKSPVSLGGTLFFSASNGRQLWKSDGTKVGTVAVTSVAADGYQQVDQIVAAGGKLYFSADTSAVAGPELFTSDGTIAGTMLLADVLPANASSAPSYLVAAGANVFFAATGTEGQEPFRYSAAGGLVQIANSLRVAGSEPRDLVAFGSGAYFTGQPQNFVRELHYNDGTSTTSDTVFDSSSSGIIGPVVATGNAVYFVKSDTTNGIELWKTTPGNPATLVKDIAPGALSSSPESLTAVENQLFFSATADGQNANRELWVTDGTANGTVVVKDFGAGGSRPRRLGAVGAKLVFAGDDGTGDKWFATNGTPAGTVALGAVSPGPCGPMGNDGVIFVCAADAFGNELWTSDGKAGSLTRWLDLAPGAASSNPALVAIHGGKVFFTATVSGKLEMYAADLLAPANDAGTEGGSGGSSGGGSSGASTSTSGGGTRIDDHEADGEGITEESGCAVAAPGKRRKRGR